MREHYEQGGRQSEQKGPGVRSEERADDELERHEQCAEHAVVEQAEEVGGKRCDPREIFGVRCAEITPHPSHGQAHDDGQSAEHRETTAQGADAALDKAREGERRAGEMKIERGEYEPPADGVRQGIAAEKGPAIGNEGEKKRREQDGKLRAEKFAMDEGAARNGSREKESGFRLGKTQSAGIRGDHPGEYHDTQEQHGADGCDEWEGLGEGLGRGQCGKGLGGGGAGGTSGSGSTSEIEKK